MRRFHQALLIGTFLPLSWLAMMVVHEAGHVLAAWLTGGVVEQVVLHPLAISRTDLSTNPHPLCVAWAGPAIGVLLPLLVCVIAGWRKWRGAYLWRFFAGFCLIANGAYLGGGSLSGVGDAGDLLRHGAALWQLLAFGLVAFPAGLWLWNGLGRHFGLGDARGEVSQSAAYLAATLLLILVVVELLFAVE